MKATSDEGRKHPSVLSFSTWFVPRWSLHPFVGRCDITLHFPGVRCGLLQRKVDKIATMDRASESPQNAGECDEAIARGGKRPRVVAASASTANAAASASCDVGKVGPIVNDVLHGVSSMTALAIVDEPSHKMRRMESDDEEEVEKERPFAPQLADYLAPDGTVVYRPRPEWFGAVTDPIDEEDGSHSQDNGIYDENLTDEAPGPVSAPDNGLLPVGSFQDFAASNMPVDAAESGGGTESLRNEENDNESTGTAVPVDEEGNISFTEASETLVHNGTEDDEESTGREAAESNSRVRPTTFGRDFDFALHVAIRENATTAALELLAVGAPVDMENAKGVTPLILAAQKGNLVLVKALLQRGASASSTTVNGTTAVLQAAHFGHLQIIRVLLQAGGSRLIELANYNHTTPLMRAAQEGHTRVVRYLLSKGALVNRRNRVHMTALMLASQRGHADICKLLIEYRADLDAMTEQDSTSLLLACKRSHLEVVRVLVTAGCELWVRDQRGRTAREAAERRQLKEMAYILDPLIQIHLMRLEARRKRSWALVRMGTLLQQERARIPFDHHVTNTSIHQLLPSLDGQNLPAHLAQSSTQALIRAMALPGPLIQAIAQFAPIPNIWDKRITLLTKQCLVNADAAVMSGLDLVDEILEDGGFLEACDAAQVLPPPNFASWVRI